MSCEQAERRKERKKEGRKEGRKEVWEKNNVKQSKTFFGRVGVGGGRVGGNDIAVTLLMLVEYNLGGWGR